MQGLEKKSRTSLIGKLSWYSVISVVVLAIFLRVLPVSVLLHPSMRLDEKDYPAMFLKDLRPYHDPLPSLFLGESVNVRVGPLGFILIVSPSRPLISSPNFNTTQLLSKWYHENHHWFETNTLKYGGILLRDFDVIDAAAFDQLIALFHEDESGTGIYLGTAPRQKINGTRYVSTASDIPRPITIPTHIELSFTPNPPRRLYFYAEQPNPGEGGQTTYSDFQAVWEKELSSVTKERLLSRGMIIERRYHNEQILRPFDPLVTKSWQNMFQTKNKTIATDLALQQHFTPIWDKDDNLLLKHRQLVIREHPDSHQMFWATHFNVLHAETYEIPYAWSAQVFESKGSLLIAWFAKVLLWVRHDVLGLPYGHNMIFADDDSPIDVETALEIRKAISRQTWIFDWKEHDVMILDNHRIAHGRSPWFTGTRKVYVAWH